MPRLPLLLIGLLTLGLVVAACSDAGTDRRVVAITQSTRSCTPTTIDLAAGEAVAFEVTNSGDRDKELEGIDGTHVDEVLVPAGRTRTIAYDAPQTAGTRKLKCYIPGGSSTIIQLRVSDAEAAPGADVPSTTTAAGSSSARYGTTAEPLAMVSVSLDSFTVAVDRPAAPTGPIRFVATNQSATDVHELAVLRVKADGSFENAGEVENLQPGKSGSILLDLPPGQYQLACLIANGEAGSMVDHYAAGMRHPFTVTG